LSAAYEPAAADFREIRKQVLAQRKVYEGSYRDVRDKVFAHNEVGGTDQANQLLAKTSVDELKALLGFLHEVHEALWQLFHNGRKPELRNRPFLLKPVQAPPSAQMRPGEKIYREGHTVLGRVVRGVEAEQS
jgi:AbiU2